MASKRNSKTNVKSKRTFSTSDSARRRLLKSLAGAGGVAAGAKMIPNNWTQPLVGTSFVPAHAQSTCTNAGTGDEEFAEFGTFSFTVPTGVCALMVAATGGAGGGGGGGSGSVLAPAPETGEQGFAGAVDNDVISVTAGQVLSVVVGDGGAGGGAAGDTTEPGGGGEGGSPDEVNGANGAPAGLSGAGGGGGGAGGTSRVFAGGTEYINAQGGAGGQGGEGAEFSAGGLGGTGNTAVQTGGEAGAGGNLAAGEDGEPGSQGNVEFSW